MNIFITGIDGYIGSVLRRTLQARGHNVAGIDTGYYQDGKSISSSQNIIHDDIRNITESQIQGFDTVIHLADLSNDPLGMIDEKITREINFQAAVTFAKKSKNAGVSRYIYSSSCSVYGNHTEYRADEKSRTTPQTMYARCKLDVEREISALADDSFSPVFLRNSTVYGISPQMRFDLVINKLAADAYLYNSIVIDNGGDQWRPLIHIRDVCRAFICSTEAPKGIVHNEIFNVGDRNGNFRISQIGELIREEFTGCQIKQGKILAADSRSYQVSFEKIHKKLPGFCCEHSVRSGIRELHTYFKQSNFTEAYYAKLQHTRVKQIKYLLQSHQLDSHYFWIKSSPATVSL